MTTEGIEFINAKPEQVIGHLINRKLWQLEVCPSRLLIKNEGKYLKLHDTRTGKQYHIRRSFLYKLLKWYSFPLFQLKRLSGDSIAGICNDYLLQIKRTRVIIKFEGEEALTILSPDYTDLTDLEVISHLSGMKMGNISRNDFMLRITSEEKHKIEPVPGENFGIGVSIINSETGFRALSISHFILRLVCSNGAIARINREQLRKIHYGSNTDELTNFLKEQISLAAAKKDELKGSIASLKEKKITDADLIVRKIQHILGSDKFKPDEHLTLFDYFNRVTDLAKKYDLLKRMHLEELAGELIIN